MKRIASILRPFSMQLQIKCADFVHALSLIEVVKDVLADARTSAFAEVFSEAEKLAEELDFELSLPRIVKRSTFRSNAELWFQIHHKHAFHLTILFPKKA